MLPIDLADSDYFLLHKMIISYINYIHTYFDWWPSISCTLLSLITFSTSRYIYFDDPADLLAYQLIFNMIWHGMNLFFIHLLISKAGMLYAETEVLRSGNNQLLDNLEEGVVIFDDKKNDIVY